MPVTDFNKKIFITSFTKNGMVKRTNLIDFKVQRYSKSINFMKLKDNDKLTDVTYSQEKQVFIATKNGYGLWYNVDEISTTGLKSSGVKSINLKNDEVVSGILFNENEEYITIITDKGTAKRLKLTEFEKGTRANRGLLLMKAIKSNPSKIIKVYIESSKNIINIKTIKETRQVKLTEIPIMDRYSNGSFIVKDRIVDIYKENNLTDSNDIIENGNNKITQIQEPKQEPSLKQIDDSFMTIDDLLNNLDK